MTDELAIQGNYADFKLVKTRSVAQIIVEVPIERAEQTVKMLGLPVPGSEIAVAVAKLHADTKPPVQPVAAPEPRTERKHWDEMRPSQQAGIRCGDTAWRRWFADRFEPPLIITSADESAALLREALGVQSRKELDSDPKKAAAWLALDARFLEETRMATRHG